jgi:hypothetical protein
MQVHISNKMAREFSDTFQSLQTLSGYQKPGYSNNFHQLHLDADFMRELAKRLEEHAHSIELAIQLAD